jgi:hypothetical protein
VLIACTSYFAMAARMQQMDKIGLLTVGVRVRKSFGDAPLPSPHLECLEGDMDLLAVSPEPCAFQSPLAFSRSDRQKPTRTTRATQRRSVTFAAESPVQFDPTDASASAFSPAPARASTRLSSDTRHIRWADSRAVPGRDGGDQQPQHTSLNLQHGGVLTAAAWQLVDDDGGAEVCSLACAYANFMSAQKTLCVCAKAMLTGFKQCSSLS